MGARPVVCGDPNLRRNRLSPQRGKKGRKVGVLVQSLFRGATSQIRGLPNRFTSQENNLNACSQRRIKTFVDAHHDALPRIMAFIQHARYSCRYVHSRQPLNG